MFQNKWLVGFSDWHYRDMVFTGSFKWIQGVGRNKPFSSYLVADQPQHSLLPIPLQLLPPILELFGIVIFLQKHFCLGVVSQVGIEEG